MAANAYEAFLQELVDSDAALTFQGLTNLSALEPEQVEMLRRAWPHVPVERRHEVTQRLTDMLEDNLDLNFESFFAVGMEDTDADVRRAAVLGLWESQDRKLIEPLVRRLRSDADEGVRAAAAQVLGQYTELAEADKLLERDARRVVGALLEAIHDPDEAREVRRRAIEAVGPISSPQVQDLIREMYDSDDEEVRASAVYAMGRSGDDEWLSFIVDEMENPSPMMRYEAATAAGRLSNEDVIPDLMRLVENDIDPDVQSAAVNALGIIGGPRGEEALQRCLKHADERVQAAAQDALEYIRSLEDPLRVLGGAVVERELGGASDDEDDDL